MRSMYDQLREEENVATHLTTKYIYPLEAKVNHIYVGGQLVNERSVLLGDHSN